MITKPFSKETYDKYNEPAKRAVANYLRSAGYIVLNFKKENFQEDLRSYLPGCFLSLRHEVEVKVGWQDEWPPQWQTIHIPYRKNKLFSHNCVQFWVLRRDFKVAYTILSFDIDDRFVINLPNKEISDGEAFFNIPQNLFRRVEL